MFKVCEGKCDQCLFSQNRIVSGQRMKEILNDCRESSTYFVCHKASIAGNKVCCSGFYETQTSNLIRIMERLNGIQFVDPATGVPTTAPARQAGDAREGGGNADQA